MVIPGQRKSAVVVRRLVLLPAALALVAIAVTGCSGSAATPAGTSHSAPAPGGTDANPPGDIPDSQAYVGYTPPSGGFTVKVPEGWARTESAQGAVFTDKLNRIELAQAPAGTAATEATVTSQVVPALTTQVPKFALGTVSGVDRSAGRAVLLTYQQDSAPDPVTGRVVRDAVERYAFFHNGREVVLTLTAAVGSDNVDPWHTVTDSLRWQ